MTKITSPSFDETTPVITTQGESTVILLVYFIRYTENTDFYYQFFSINFTLSSTSFCLNDDDYVFCICLSPFSKYFSNGHTYTSPFHISFLLILIYKPTTTTSLIIIFIIIIIIMALKIIVTMMMMMMIIMVMKIKAPQNLNCL